MRTPVHDLRYALRGFARAASTGPLEALRHE
jgi:hypothetical protein